MVRGHPSLTKVTGSAAMMPAFFRPMNVRKMPIPAAVATRRLGGSRARRSRARASREMRRKSTPAQKTIPERDRPRDPVR